VGIIRLIQFVTLCLLISACSSSGSNTPVVDARNQTSGDPSSLYIVHELPAPDNTRNGTDVLLASGDILEIDVFRVNELNKTVKINSHGHVSLPLIGSISAAGMTAETFESVLENRYGGNYLQSPEITVFVKKSVGRQIVLDGEFSQPGIYTAENNTSLIQVVAQARGLSDLADEQKIYIYRNVGGRKLVANQDLKAIRSGKDADPKIYGGDVIIAFASKQKIANKRLREALGVAVSAARIATPF